MKKRFVGFSLIVLLAFLGGVPGCGNQDSAKTHTVRLGNMDLEMVLIPAGSFRMGSADGDEDEAPAHKVTINRPFYLGKYEVTQAQWEAVMGSNPSGFKGETNPVENVSWDDVQEFIKRLNEKEGTTGYRLPTEAEWEYAARAGTDTHYFFGNDEGELSKYAWYEDNSGEETHPAGQMQPNPWGLYDIYGNAWEWVEDWYEEGYYAESPGTDPKGQSSGSYRVLRGGS
jgi:formylglycine-generating enzyme required for sulfatase activity